jgi:hypothetical protein
MCVFRHRGQCPACGRAKQVQIDDWEGTEAAAAKGVKPLTEAAGVAGLVVEGLSRGVALDCQGAPDQLAGIPHVIRLGIARGAASVIAEADALEELSKFPRFGLGQRDCDLDGVHDRLLVRCGPGLPSAARSRVKGGRPRPFTQPLTRRARC